MRSTGFSMGAILVLTPMCAPIKEIKLKGVHPSGSRNLSLPTRGWDLNSSAEVLLGHTVDCLADALAALAKIYVFR